MGAAQELERLEATSPKVLIGLPASPRLAWPEALAFPAGWLLALPIPVALSMHVPGIAGVVRAGRGGQSEPDALFIDAEEWAAIVLGAEADRLWPADLRALCDRKRADPSFRVTVEVVLDGAQADPDEQWCVSRVLRRIGAEPIAIELEG